MLQKTEFVAGGTRACWRGAVIVDSPEQDDTVRDVQNHRSFQSIRNVTFRRLISKLLEQVAVIERPRAVLPEEAGRL